MKVKNVEQKLLIGECLHVHSPTKVLSLKWRHNDHDSVSNHQPHGCLLNRLFRRRSKKTSKLRVTGLCVGNSPALVNSPHKWPVTRKMLPFDDVIMEYTRRYYGANVKLFFQLLPLNGKITVYLYCPWWHYKNTAMQITRTEILTSHDLSLSRLAVPCYTYI